MSIFTPPVMNTFSKTYSRCNRQLVVTEKLKSIHPNARGTNSRNISMVVPYIKGLGQKFKRTCNNLGIQVHFKGNNTINSLLMAPKMGEINSKNVGLYTGLSAHTSTTKRST